MAVAVYLLFVVLPWGRSLDHAAFVGRLDAGRHLLGISRLLLGLISVPLVAAVLLLLIWWGRRTGRLRDGLVCAAAVAGSALSAEALKLLLPASAGHGTALRLAGAGSFPSGHATIATALALAFLALAPAHLRPRLIGPALAWTVVVAAATVTAGWHRPSDAVGGILLAVAWHRALWATARTDHSSAIPQDAWPSPRPPLGPFSTPGARPSHRQESHRQPSGRQALGWGPWSWWAAAAVVELTLLMLPSPAESPWEPAAVRHYLAVTLLLAAGGASMLWAAATMPDPVSRVPASSVPVAAGSLRG